jgi:triphosphoribosyl-dephospho-CoA synthetase
VTAPPLPARAVLRGLVTQLRAGIAADRKRVTRGRSLTASKRATKTLRAAVIAVKPDTNATKRGRRALLQALDHRARALTANRTRTAKRLLALAARDAVQAASYLR